MKAPNSRLTVTSHVGRDLLASAAAFKNEAVAVWEYVANSIEYVDRGTTPKVQVRVQPKQRRIVIADNGKGMGTDDLRHYFTMHGENRDRLAGRLGRGKFGTGKSAAFGIANGLRIETVREGHRNVVSLTREMIEASSGEDIPVNWEVRDESTTAPQGTVVTIEDVALSQLRSAPISEYIERHLQAFRAIAPEVAVNNHVCSYREPEVEASHEFLPSSSQAKTLGDIKLVVKVARAPLLEADQGIVITAGPGNLVAIERGGIQTKEFGSYLFGEVDVPAIETYDTKLSPYDSSRSLQLNPEHPVVAVLLGFIGSHLEAVRRDLVTRSQQARKTEQARRLALEADRIADILNDDYREHQQRLQAIRAASSRRDGSAEAQFGDAELAGEVPTDWVKGTERPGDVEVTSGTPRGGRGTGRVPPNITPQGHPNDEGKQAVDPSGGSGQKRRPRGGFHVDYRNLGKAEERSRYDSPTLTILINLEHPVVAAALGDGRTEDPTFRRLSYEIAFSEYAMALGYEMLKQDPNISADDLLYEVRSTLNRVAASAAALYR